MSLRRGAKQQDEWVRNRIDEQAVDAGCWFDLAAADRVRKFASLCRQSKGEWAGKPVELLDWQWRDLVAPLFGWKRADGTRRYRSFYVEVPKKNGKSTLMSVLELYLLMGDGEPGAEVYTAAADRDQASIIHNEAEAMVRMSPAFSRRLICTTSRKTIAYPVTSSTLKAMSADAPTKEGLNAHAVIFDELHAQRTPVLWDTLRFSGAARRQPIIGSITTAGYDRHSICYEQRQIAEQVIDGTYPAWDFLGVIYAADPEDDWTSPDVWRAANPSLGVTIKEADMAAACAEAQASPRKENSFKRYRLNIWTEQDVRWLSMEAWDACKADPPDLTGCPAWLGLDLSTRVDLTASVAVVRHEDTWWIVPRFFIPGDRIREREDRDRVPYSQWVNEGWITATPGNVVDYQAVRRTVREDAARYDLQEIAIDPWNAQQLATQLAEEDGYRVVEFRQGYGSLSGPSKDLEALILSAGMHHDGNPVLRWNAGNVAVETDASGNIKPSKAKSTERIDGIVAAVMGIGRAMLNVDDSSVYSSRGLLVL